MEKNYGTMSIVFVQMLRPCGWNFLSQTSPKLFLKLPWMSARCIGGISATKVTFGFFL
jgi:hypothetical protein